MHHAHRAVREETFVAPINPGAPARIRYGESERKQKRRAQKIGKSRGFDFKSLRRSEGKSIVPALRRHKGRGRKGRHNHIPRHGLPHLPAMQCTKGGLRAGENVRQVPP
ncbi:MAG: hypothetical protein DME76_04295 [Verrucomicrobia bacterium]|nr:MAG: hypothetical protein DME76_04295 [Verrucomicrobiota bacterium]